MSGRAAAPLRTVDAADPAAAATAVAVLLDGGLVVAPTPRWYMVCADSTNDAACRRVFDVKQRPEHKQLAYALPARDATSEGFRLNDAARRLADAFWPGDLALLLERESTAADGPEVWMTTVDGGVIGAVASALGRPVAMSSANVSGRNGTLPAVSMDEVRSFAAGSASSISLVVNGGVCPAARHLTVVDCTGLTPVLVRTGLVHERALAAVLRHTL